MRLKFFLQFTDLAASLSCFQVVSPFFGFPIEFRVGPSLDHVTLDFVCLFILLAAFPVFSQVVLGHCKCALEESPVGAKSSEVLLAFTITRLRMRT